MKVRSLAILVGSLMSSLVSKAHDTVHEISLYSFERAGMRWLLLPSEDGQHRVWSEPQTRKELTDLIQELNQGLDGTVKIKRVLVHQARLGSQDDMVAK